MSKKIPFVTPVGVAKYPYLTQPDMTGKFADGKFKTRLIVSKKDAKGFIDNIKNTAKALGLKKLPYADDPDNEENIVITVKSKFAPVLFDPKKQEVKGVVVKGGSKIRIAGIVFPYDTGLSLQMKQVQIIDLVAGTEGSMFDEIEGSFDGSEIESEEPTFGEDLGGTNTNELDI